MSLKKSAAVAECSPQAKNVAVVCQSDNSTDMCIALSAASSCQQSANGISEVHPFQVEENVPQKVEESKKVDVRVKTPEKCCNVTKVKKTLSPILATDKCTVSLSRIAVPENNAVKVSEISACKDTPPVSSRPVVVDDVRPASTTNLSVPDDDSGNACDDGKEDHLQLPSLRLTSIVYPSCEQNVFLGSFGLASKSELPQLQNVTSSRLHRAIGGKLRRSIRPNLGTHMLYRRTNSTRCVSFESNTDVSGIELGSRSLHTSRESSPRSSHACDLSSNVSVKKLSSVLLKRLKSSDFSKTVDSGSSVESCEMETTESTINDSEQHQSSLSILADMAVANLEAAMIQDTKPVTPAQNVTQREKPKVRYGNLVFKFSFFDGVKMLQLEFGWRVIKTRFKLQLVSNRFLTAFSALTL